MDTGGMKMDDLLAGFTDDAFVLVYGASSAAAPSLVLWAGYSKKHLPHLPLTCPDPDCCRGGFHLCGEALDVSLPVTRGGMSRLTATIYCPGTVGLGRTEATPCKRYVHVEIFGHLWPPV